MTAIGAGHVVGGRYKLVAELGSGGFGRVWRAHDETLGVEVAIKELRMPPGLSQAEQDERLARAVREARNAARLRNHENIVAIYDAVTDDDRPWIVMELVQGRSLAEHVAAHGPLSTDMAAKLATALLSAVGAAHQEGLVHRDIKPANVMITDTGRVVLTDFGTAVHQSDTALTATGMFIGSLEYIAPERLRTDGLPASDLFSVGVALYQAVEGVSPFRRDSPEATLAALLLGEVPEPSRAGALTQLITRLLDKDPDTRPTVPEAMAMIGDTDDTKILTTPSPKQSPEPEPGPSPGSWRKRLPTAASGMLMALVAALGVVGLWYYGRSYGDDGWRFFTLDPAGYRGSFVTTAFQLVVVLVGGVVCADLTRFLPIPVRLAGLLVGGAATVYAFHGVAYIVWSTDGYGSAATETAVLSVSGIVLAAAVLAWAARRVSRPRP
ncbi:serine/threonine-protein kinase [Allokutzneria albata]|uniref:non-specific serine/threonine protein kinase n=1 Tax=Allokutzneria albata TaxID=211114 RepID=A0A1G9WC85_ALLAB|nr:serine/threonine-protein kinase [Allokutzneria albata]SDM81811.1 Serine/threonine protein kinase [Allokutzneria albata]